LNYGSNAHRITENGAFGNRCGKNHWPRKATKLPYGVDTFLCFHIMYSVPTFQEKVEYKTYSRLRNMTDEEFDTQIWDQEEEEVSPVEEVSDVEEEEEESAVMEPEEI